MPRSLLERADLRRLRAAAEHGPGAIPVACLLQGGALAFDDDEPDWPERDRLILADGSAAAAASARIDPAALAAALVPGGAGTRWAPAPAQTALAVAYGLAAAAHLAGGLWRTWCLLGDDAADAGGTWEAALAAGEAGMTDLTAVVVGRSPGAAARLFAAAGWRVDEVEADDAAAVLAALDVVLQGASEPTAVLARVGSGG